MEAIGGALGLLFIGLWIVAIVDAIRNRECPYCCKHISKRATRCPHCTSAIPPPPPARPPVDDPARGRLR